MLKRLSVMLLLLMAFITACSGGTSPGGGASGGAANAGKEPPGIARVTDPNQKAELKARVEAAIKEGGVHFSDTIVTPETADKLAKGFKEYWGLPATFDSKYTNYSSSQFITKASEELAAGKVTIDVGGVAALPWLYDLALNKKEVMEYASPVYDEYTRILDMKLGVRNYFVSNVFFFIPMWNPDVVKKDIKSYRDLLDPAFAGKIIQGDVARSESYAMVYLGLKKVLSPDDFKKLAELKPAAKVNAKEMAQDNVTGEYPIGWSGMPTRAWQFAEKGIKLKFVFPSEGTVFVPQSVFIMKRAPHPNAAKLFYDYFLSEPGQKVYVGSEAVSSGRDNFQSPIPEYAPAIDKIKAIDIDWSKVTVKDMEDARKAWSAIFTNQ